MPYLLQSPPSLERIPVMVTVMGEAGANDTNTFLWWKGTANLPSHLRRLSPWDGSWVLFGESRVLVGYTLKARDLGDIPGSAFQAFLMWPEVKDIAGKLFPQSGR